MVYELIVYPAEASSWCFLAFATVMHRESFDVNTLSGKLDQLASPNLQDVFIER